MGAGGSGQTQLTSVGDNWGGSWSPHTDTIAFASSRGGRLRIYTMHSDGSAQRRLMTSTGDEWLPEWSPDGGELAFNSTRDGSAQIWVADADGSHPTNLLRATGLQLDGWTPRWSPYGRAIVYAAGGNPRSLRIPFAQVRKPGRMTGPLLQFVQDPCAGELTSVGLRALGDGECRFQHREPFGPLVRQRGDRPKRLGLVHFLFLP